MKTHSELASILVRDLMERDVLVLAADDPIEAAIAQLEDYGVSGCPVADATGQPVGMLSRTDLARSERADGSRIAVGRSEYRFRSQDETDEEGVEEDYDPGTLDERVTVGDWMTHAVVSIRPDAKLQELCRKMVDESVHRVVVTEGGRIVGLVSTFDIVELLAGEK